MDNNFDNWLSGEQYQLVRKERLRLMMIMESMPNVRGSNRLKKNNIGYDRSLAMIDAVNGKWRSKISMIFLNKILKGDSTRLLFYSYGVLFLNWSLATTLRLMETGYVEKDISGDNHFVDDVLSGKMTKIKNILYIANKHYNTTTHHYLYVFGLKNKTGEILKEKKIGISTNILSRIKTIYTNNPYDVEILSLWEIEKNHLMRIEQFLNLKFKNINIRNEWYYDEDGTLEEDVNVWINKIKSYHRLEIRKVEKLKLTQYSIDKYKKCKKEFTVRYDNNTI
jgi:hypothetical protein